MSDQCIHFSIDASELFGSKITKLLLPHKVKTRSKMQYGDVHCRLKAYSHISDRGRSQKIKSLAQRIHMDSQERTTDSQQGRGGLQVT